MCQNIIRQPPAQAAAGPDAGHCHISYLYAALLLLDTMDPDVAETILAAVESPLNAVALV